jgi:outer membrane protein TolC
MRRWHFLGVTLVLFLAAGLAGAQTFPTPRFFQRFFSRPNLPSQVPGSKGIDAYVKDGKLSLGLEDMIALTLANNTDVRMNSLNLQLSALSLKRAYSPFDPLFTSSFSPAGSKSYSSTDPDGADFGLSHATGFGYEQTLQTGTSYAVDLSSSRYTGDEYTFPNYTSSLKFSFSQPLLRGRGFLPNRAPIVIAQRSVKQSHADFEAQVNSSIANAITQYWDVLLARKNLDVLRKSLDLAQKTYDRDKRTLELGALPPFDIYRSELQLAQRKLSVVQAEYRLKQLEDDFRRTIGADLDPQYSSMIIELTENVQVSGELPIVDAQEAMRKALSSRPELQSLGLQLENATTNAQVANHNLKPDLSLSAYYTGRGGSSQSLGLAEALDQMSGFGYPSYGATLSLRLPLRNRGAEADLGTALVNRQRTLYSMRQRTQSITLEVRNALNQIEGAKLAIQAAQVALDIAQKNVDAEQRKYDLGAQIMFFVLDAQTNLVVAQQSLLQAQVDYQRALTALDRATGELLAKHRVQIANVTN